MMVDIPLGQVQLDPTGRIAQDVLCVHCGYNLRSLLVEQACPECNQPIALSLRGDRLQLGNPAWLRNLASGVGLIALAGILNLLLDIAQRLPSWFVAIAQRQLLPPWVQSPGSAALRYASIMFTECYFVVKAINLLGIWWVTSPEPPRQQLSSDSNVRRYIRILVFGSCIPALAAALLLWFSEHLHVILWSTVIGMSAIHSVGLVLLWIYLAQLGGRLPARWLVRSTWAVCAIEALIGGAALRVGAMHVSAIANPRMPGIAVSPGIMWLFTIEQYGPLMLSVVTVALAAAYRRRFREVLRQLHGIVQAPIASTGT